MLEGRARPIRKGMRILFFGRLADRFGRTVDLDVPPGATVADIRALLLLTEPAVRACVGDTIVAEDFLPAPGAEVEFWPPVSGG